MDGVTILAEHTVSNLCQASVFWALLLTVVAGTALYLTHEEGGCLTWIFGVALVILAVLYWLVVWYGAITFHTEYSVTIDDSASYNEFTKTYEVVSEEDGVYRVKLKEADQ